MTDRPPVRRHTTARPPVRRPHTVAPMRRTRVVRRASAGLSPVRAGAMLTMLLCSAGIYGVASASAFAYDTLRVEGAVFTPTDNIEAAIATARGENIFSLVTAPLEARIRELPTVRSADVTVRLPGTLVARIEERVAILVWRIGARRYLVDIDGHLFAWLGEDAPPDAATLPVVEDRRAASAGLSIGRRLESVDLDAATRLASVQPVDVGSEADGLAVQLTDANGFMLRARPASWAAVFGFYTPSLRTTELIPDQVRLLRSLLIGREPMLERIILASGTDGTYTLRPTPPPSEQPSATPAP